MPKLLSLFCKRIGKGEKKKNQKAKAEHSSPRQAILAKRDIAKNTIKERSRVEKALPGCRDESRICKDCCQLLITGESVTPLIFFTINFKSRE